MTFLKNLRESRFWFNASCCAVCWQEVFARDAENVKCRRFESIDSMFPGAPGPYILRVRESQGEPSCVCCYRVSEHWFAKSGRFLELCLGVFVWRCPTGSWQDMTPLVHAEQLFNRAAVFDSCCRDAWNHSGETKEQNEGQGVSCSGMVWEELWARALLNSHHMPECVKYFCYLAQDRRHHS